MFPEINSSTFTGSAVARRRLLPFFFPRSVFYRRSTSPHLPSPPAMRLMDNAAALMNPWDACGIPPPSLTAVLCEALMAEFTQALEAVVDVLHFLLQVRVLLVQLVLFGVPLQWGDQILVYFC